MARNVKFELRLGLVMYGGISLAVYMNGMTQELLALVRAAQALRMAGNPGEELAWVQEQRERNPYYRLLEWAQVDVVIDVISGTSAGGLNGLLLGKALATGAPDLDEMTRMWQEKAQITDLATYDREPTAILSGKYLEDRLTEVMRGLSARSDQSLADQVPVLDLFIPATDLAGQVWTRRDPFGQVLSGTAHKHIFHLKKRTATGDRGYEQNDFQGGPEKAEALDSLLARIGRATSAFPGALPAVKISQADAVRAGLDLPDLKEEGAWFNDGGILMNKPFEPVLHAIHQRSADLPVRRVLAYLEPDPVQAKESPEKEPTMLGTVLAGITLPMNQDIQEMLDRLEVENRRHERLLRFMAELDRVMPESADETEGTGDSEVIRAFREAAMSIMEEGTSRRSGTGRAVFPAMLSYYQLRLHSVREGLQHAVASALSGLRQVAANDEAAHDEIVKAANLVVAALRLPAGDTRMSEQQIADTERALSLFDIPYHCRRLHFLLSRVHQQYQPGTVPADTGAMQQMLQHLWGGLEDWRNAAWAIRQAGRIGRQAADLRGAAEELDEWFVRLAGATGLAQKAAAEEAAHALAQYLKAVQQRAAQAEELAMAAALQALPLQSAEGEEVLTAAMLSEASQQYIQRDLILFPLEAYGDSGAWNPVELYRLSPVDATQWVNRPVSDRLAGEKLDHFSAFFDRRWRSNDIMWGRLDGAELLTRLILRELGHNVPESEYPREARMSLAGRRRQIMTDFVDILDLRTLRRMAAGVEYEEVSGAEALSMVRARREAAVALMPPEQAGDALTGIPDRVLREYLQTKHHVGEESLKDLPPRRLAGEILLMLHNTAEALARPGASGMVNTMQKAVLLFLNPLQWVARMILIPQTGLYGAVQSNAVPIMAVVGGALLVLQAVGAVRLMGVGWAVAVALLFPAGLNLFFRPSLLRVILTGVLALGAGIGALGNRLTDLPAWLQTLLTSGAWLFEPLGRVWGFCLLLFCVVTVAYRFSRSLKR